MISQKVKKIFDMFTSTRAAGMYILLFAIAIGVATFVENDFGTSSAQDLIFKSKWFELLLVLFSIAILANIWRYKLIKQKKWASLGFHSAIIVILIGSALTRYIGTEGMMHIREGETTDKYLSSESFLKFKVLKDGKSYSFDEPLYLSSLGSNKFKSSYQIGNSLIDVNLDGFLPNPTETATPSPDGVPMIKVVIGGAGGREEYFVKKGERVTINGVNFNFTDEFLPDAFNVTQDKDSLLFSTQETINQRVMATQKVDDLVGGIPHRLMLRSLYTLGSASFVVGEYIPNGKVNVASGSPKLKNESTMGLNLSVSVNGKPQKTMVVGRKGDEGQAQVLSFDGLELAISYGSKVETLPFSLLCKDFILEKYPGTENPSSYASEVTLIDIKNSVNRDQRIFMNNILDYNGYRFFQSSFDQDELGTYLSVNHDFWGTWVSYFGYALLTIASLMTFFDKKSRFTYLLNKLKGFQTQTTIVAFMLFSIGAIAQENNPITKDHASEFGRLVVQDQNGRLKPMNTATGEVLRKISRKESLFGQTSDQIILSMIIDPALWEKSNIIQVPNVPELKKLLNTQESMVSYASFFNTEGNYILADQVKAAQAMMPKDQGTLDKALIKIDEKVNIVNMVFSGSFFKMFPVPNDNTNTWVSAAELLHEHQGSSNNEEAKALFIRYLQALSDGIKSNNFNNAQIELSQIASFQQKYGSAIMPEQSKLSAEITLNKLNVFNRLGTYYAILCLVITGLFFYITIKRNSSRDKWTKYAFYAMALGFLFHTIGLGLRWYVSGRAPWSNGYESMIYIGWTTMLAGTLISRKSLGGLAATATLAATIMMVAGLSYLDPEITPLVPVLKSYWLTIHVSLEAGSYGFLLLGAVLGMLNLVMMILVNDKNKENITRAIKELTVISEITLLAGLAMISIGTYLGGVWANESWGRYWGWDAKETWALVTILVYAFILHMRFIPKMQSIYAFNFASLFGFATVLMTYFGVNYYLSGLHSYAAGDPVPIPSWVYITAIGLALLSGVAYRNYKKRMA